MNVKSYIPAMAASLLLGSASFAVAADQQNTATTFGAGTAEANRNGAQAGAVTAGQARYSTPSQAKKNKKNRGGQHSGQNKDGSAQMNGGAQVTLPNSATTFGTGAVFTNRNTASGAASTGATATGAGTQAATSDAYVFGSTDKNGSEAEAQGTSTAVSQEPKRRPRSN